MTTMSIGDLSFGFEDTGDGVPLVLIHGHPFDRSMWRPQLDWFGARGWRVVTPDLRGYGASTVVPGKTPFATFARDVVDLLDGLGIDDVVLGGLSMGGQIAMELQRSFPQRLRGLLLAATSPLPETAAGAQQRRAAADRLSREGMSGYAREALPLMVSPLSVDTRREVVEQVTRMMLATPAEGAAAALRGRAERPDYRPTLARIEVPTLVVVGRHDAFTLVGDVERWCRDIPGARLVVIEGAGHLPNLECPTEFNEALQGLLDEVSG